ncbi:hypothetical protein BXZ70DRAFT_291853 [Cristinia sonorae]|uniref:F-box domain-containing protein n=1 Tax=Cristinia sonorae TaxID=1940300 RepID=A0A8K0UL27_9AGAR|nr:hypothetical protein BXZ70DRAFT_291853 [Cristinia sonorae]
MDLPSHREGVVYLQPRPMALSSGKLLLLPLLPRRKPPISLPCELWTQIFEHVLTGYPREKEDTSSTSLKIGLLLVCKAFKEIASPPFYSYIRVKRISSLQDLTGLLTEADRKWDSIRRIPFSAPGRWIRAMDLSNLLLDNEDEACQIDPILTRLFPLVPCLESLTLNSTIVLSRLAWESMANRDGVGNLRSLSGVKIVHPSPFPPRTEGSLLDVLRASVQLEELQIVGSGIEAVELAAATSDTDFQSCTMSLDLPRLRRLSLISMHSSAVMLALFNSSLPSLLHLTVTPYDDISIPTSLVPKFIETHGPKLASLHLYANKSWPTMLFPSPTTLLSTCPRLRHLSLENPLPALTICSIYPRYPLRILSIPRPNSEFLRVLETLLPKLPDLRIIRTRDSRWLRSGITGRAREAGVQGEMREWRRRLSRRGIQLVDADWKPGD